MTSARQILYEGKVQGVGFRYSVKQIAKGFDVCGWVRNLPDGNVELQAAGEETEVHAFLLAIRESDLAAHIKNEKSNTIPFPAEMRGFEIAI